MCSAASRESVEPAQFPRSAFTGLLRDHDIRISMDGKGCWRNNVFIEMSLALDQVRGGLPACLRNRERGPRRHRPLRHLLQLAPTALESPGSNPGRGAPHIAASAFGLSSLTPQGQLMNLRNLFRSMGPALPEPDRHHLSKAEWLLARFDQRCPVTLTQRQARTSALPFAAMQSCPRRRVVGACDEPTDRRTGQLVSWAQDRRKPPTNRPEEPKLLSSLHQAKLREGIDGIPARLRMFCITRPDPCFFIRKRAALT